jgi:hypothetical protein
MTAIDNVVAYVEGEGEGEAPIGPRPDFVSVMGSDSSFFDSRQGGGNHVNFVLENGFDPTSGQYAGSGVSPRGSRNEDRRIAAREHDVAIVEVSFS